MADDDGFPANFSSGDKALLRTAATGEGAIPLTSELLKKISEDLAARHADIEARYPALVEECPYETRLAVVAWAMKHIVDHARDRGTYRYLIYDRLGFGPDAYVPLCADGLTISNEFDLAAERLGIEQMYLIWSNEHQGFWRPSKHGYTADQSEAGRFDWKQACEILKQANVVRAEEFLLPVPGI